MKRSSKNNGKSTPTIISISGIDGSGKSTQVKRLTTFLEGFEYKVYYFHAVQFSIANRGKSEKPGEAKAVTQASWLSLQLRKVALLIDLLRFESLKSRLHEQGYTYIVSDRYFYDSLINIAYLSKARSLYGFGINFLASLIDRPHFPLYLSVSPEEILKRDRTIEQGENYLKEKSQILMIKAHEWDLTKISGEKESEIIHEEIRDIVHQKIDVQVLDKRPERFGDKNREGTVN